jgi:hypothetical protein
MKVVRCAVGVDQALVLPAFFFVPARSRRASFRVLFGIGVSERERRQALPTPVCGSTEPIGWRGKQGIMAWAICPNRAV